MTRLSAVRTQGAVARNRVLKARSYLCATSKHVSVVMRAPSALRNLVLAPDTGFLATDARLLAMSTRFIAPDKPLLATTRPPCAPAALV